MPLAVDSVTLTDVVITPWISTRNKAIVFPLLPSSTDASLTLTHGAAVVTVTLKLPVARLPCVSVAEQLTMVVPTANVLPDAGEQRTFTLPSTRSAADVVKSTIAPDGPVASRVIAAGSVNTGGVVSRTVIVKDGAATFPVASLAEQVTVVVPSGNVDPLVKLHETVGAGSTMSLAVGTANMATAPVGMVASTV